MKWNKNIIWTSVAFGGSLVVWCNKNAFINSSHCQMNQSPLKNETSYIFLPKDSVQEFYDDLSVNFLHHIDYYSTKHWNLLMLAKSNKKTVRHKAVKSLSQLQLHNWQYKMIAQACDPRTAIGLAKYPDSDVAYFLTSPFKNLDQPNWRKDLLQLLIRLCTRDADVCIQQLTQKVQVLAKQLLKEDKDWNSELEDSFNIYHPERKKRVSDAFDKVALQAVLSYSSVKMNRSIMLGSGILKLLDAIFKVHEEETEYQSLIAQILGNFALEKSFEKDFHLTGWIGVLAQWCKSSSIEVSLPAAKALANLDRDDYYYSYYDSGVYLLHPLYRFRKESCADIIFVHGLLGGTFWTWRQHDSMKMNIRNDLGSADSSNFNSINRNYDPFYTKCWPKDWLAKDIPDARLISADYNSCLSKWNAGCPRIEERDSLDAKANYLLDKLSSSKIGNKPIIWITHSMGGLLVKQILVQCMESSDKSLKSIAQNTKGIIFFSVPHKGSDLVKFIHSVPYIFQPSIDIMDLCKGSEKLLALHKTFMDFVNKNSVAILSFGETKKTKWGLTLSMLVTEDSSDPGVGEFFSLPVDHLSTCKPESPESEVYKKILEFLYKNIPSSMARSTKLDFEISNILSLIT